MIFMKLRTLNFKRIIQFLLLLLLLLNLRIVKRGKLDPREKMSEMWMMI
jgi:hypothetical protein